MSEQHDVPVSVEDDPATEESLLPEPEPVIPLSRNGCCTDLRGWAGAHLHGAVRPRRRAAGRGRPPGRWC